MQKKIDTFIQVFIEEGGYRDVLTGLRNTLLIAVLGLVIGIIIGTMIAAVRVMPKYKRLPRILDRIGRFYVGFFRGTPMVVQLLLFWYVLLPLLQVNLPSLALGSIVIGPEVWASVIVFGLNSGAYISEIMRGGIQSVDYGQTEGGRSVGLSYGTTMMKIVIPQAVKNILPTMGNEFITLIKETSVVSFIGATDLYKAFNDMGSNTYEFMIPYLAMGIIYVVLVSIIALGIKLMERRLARSDRNH